MKASEIRRELVAQHAEVRSRIEETRAAMAAWRRGQPSGDLVRSALARLAQAMRSHNLREEELLCGLVRSVDAWGPVREEIMNEEHVKEHDELYAAMIEAGTAVDAAAAERLVEGVLAKLAGHMEREEKTFLNGDVLRDDIVLVDSFSG